MLDRKKTTGILPVYIYDTKSHDKVLFKIKAFKLLRNKGYMETTDQ